MDDIVRLRQLARSGFQHVPAPDNGIVLGTEAVQDASAPTPSVPALPSLSNQSSSLDDKHLCFEKFLELVVAGYAADPDFHKHTHLLTQVGHYWFKEQALALPNHSDLRNMAMYQMHDAPWSAHVGRNRTLDIIRTSYWWPSIDADVRSYVASCDKCQRNKAHHSVKQKFMLPLPVPERPFQTVGVDFITQLPTTVSGFDAICVIVCHFTKLAHFIPCHSDIDARQFAFLFRKHFVRHHGLPMHIVSDRGSQFVAHFWRQLCSDLGVTLRMTSAHQPSSDGQVERINKVLEEAIRSYVNNLHNDWDTWIDCVEFAHNRSTASAHSMSPFSLVYHYEPLAPPDLALFSELPLHAKRGPSPGPPTSKSRSGHRYCISWVTKFQSARALLQQAKDRMRDSANRSRIDRQFDVGDFVMLNTRTYRLKKPAPSEKFLPRFCGPFKIVSRVGPSAYKLALPLACKIHPVVHVSKLWKYTPRHNVAQPPPPILLEHSQTFQVLDILSHRGSPSSRQYLVQWKGSDCMYNTWEPKSSLSACSELVAAYEERASSVAPAQGVYAYWLGY